MHATVMDGPYENKAVDHNDLNLYCRLIVEGLRKFFIFPPIEQWDDVSHDRLSKNGPFDGDCYIYELERTQQGVKLWLDHDGSRLMGARLLASLPQPAAPTPKGKYYECVPTAQLADSSGRFHITDEKDRQWGCKEGPVNGGPWPDGAMNVVIHYAENLEDLRHSLSDVID